tara:strand:+ start:1712 stop:2140 length:429 start_codon:yes stop_codon:yes gene_type:complete
MFAIFDFDGTICDLTHRLHHIKGEKKDFDAFHAACVDDAPKPEIMNILGSLVNSQFKIEIWSGRSDIVRDQSMTWLDRNGINPFLLTNMRQHGDYTPDDKLKRHWLRSLDVRPNVVFDDRQRVVDMWRKEGITCCQVDAWKE